MSRVYIRQEMFPHTSRAQGERRDRGQTDETRRPDTPRFARRGVRRAGLLIALILSVDAFAGDASAAEDVGACDGARASLAEAELLAIDQRMEAEARRALAWSTIWAATGTALAFGNYTRATITPSEADRTDSVVAGTASFFIPALIFLKPLRVIGDSEALQHPPVDGSSSSIPANPSTPANPATPANQANPCAALARANHLLDLSAADEAEKTGALAQAVTIGGNLAIGLILALGFHHGWAGVVNGVGGLALGELQIATTPRGLLTRSTSPGAKGATVAQEQEGAPRWSVAPLVLGSERGLALRLVF